MRRRAAAFSLLVGLAAGMLIAGLLIPLLAGDFRTTANAPIGSVTGGTTGPVAASAASVQGGAPTGAAIGPAAPGTTATGPARSGAIGPGAGSSTAIAAGSLGLGATDQGVTATSIKVGFLLYDLGGEASAVGFSGSVTGLDPKQQQAAFQAYVDDVNRRGGIAGRRIEPVYSKFDILSSDSQLAACLSLTEDAKVFALVGQFFYQAPYLCATQQHHRPMVTLGEVIGGDIYQQSGGLLFTMFAEGNRMMARFASELQRAGLLAGHTIGIVSDDGYDPGGQTTAALVAALRSFHGNIGHVTHFSADLSTAASQVPVEVQSMRAAGVDTVLLMANPIESTQFVQEATHEAYPVRYDTSEWAAMGNDVGQENMPPSYDGTLNFVTEDFGDSRVGISETAEQARCRQLYETATKQTLTRDTTPYGVAMSECSQLRVFELGAAEAAVDLSAATFSIGMQHIGSPTVALFAGGSYAPGKFGFGDLTRTMRWSSSCKCSVPISGWRQPSL